MADDHVDSKRRRLLTIATTGVGLVGAAGLAVPFAKPVWIIRRSPEILELLPSIDSRLSDPNSEAGQQPSYAQNGFRSIKDEILVLVGICTHLGCSPKYQPEIGPVEFDNDWKGGFLCACHGSKFDLAGRVFSGVPAPTNLVVPPHQYLTDDVLLIGDDGGVA